MGASAAGASAAQATDEYKEALIQVEALKKFTDLGMIYQTPRQNLNDGATAEYAV